MPLTVLLPLVVIGIAGIVVLIRLLQPTPKLVFDTPESAQTIWNHRNHEAPATDVHLTPARTHVLVETGAGPGILWSFGVDPVTRLLDQPVSCRDTGKGLRIDTHDFTAPHIEIPLADPDQRAHWLRVLKSEAS